MNNRESVGHYVFFSLWFTAFYVYLRYTFNSTTSDLIDPSSFIWIMIPTYGLFVLLYGFFIIEPCFYGKRYSEATLYILVVLFCAGAIWWMRYTYGAYYECQIQPHDEHWYNPRLFSFRMSVWWSMVPLVAFALFSIIKSNLSEGSKSYDEFLPLADSEVEPPRVSTLDKLIDRAYAEYGEESKDSASFRAGYLAARNRAFVVRKFYVSILTIVVCCFLLLSSCWIWLPMAIMSYIYLLKIPRWNKVFIPMLIFAMAMMAIDHINLPWPWIYNQTAWMIISGAYMLVAVPTGVAFLSIFDGAFPFDQEEDKKRYNKVFKWGLLIFPTILAIFGITMLF